MRILVASHVFAPSIGGIESISAMLSGAFVSLGHEVKLVTQTPRGDCDESDFGYPIIRQPGSGEYRKLLQWAEVYWQNNVSLPLLMPAIFARKPTVVTTQTWLMRTDGRIALRDWLKKLTLGRVRNVAISQAIAAHLPGQPTIIGNPYRDELFRRDESIEKDRDVVFLGRLVSDKGADTLLTALKGSDASCTIIGDGPERAALEAQAAGLNVHFTGAMSGQPLVKELNRHRTMVVPSRWQEPFGIVALEGLACGCVPIVSAGGGLPDAIGPCGTTFTNGNAAELRRELEALLGNEARCHELRSLAPAHLAKFTTTAVASRYLLELGEA